MDRKFLQQLEQVPNRYGDEALFNLIQRTKEGARQRFCRLSDLVKNRLINEFELIYVTNTAKLFLFWSDIVSAIKQRIYPYICSIQNCSLVCYCLGITEVNPLLTYSYFERLLTPKSTNIPVLLIEVSKGKGEEVSEYLEEEEKALIEIKENAARPNLDPKDVADFFKQQTYENREILQNVAVSLGIIGKKKAPETVRELADLLVYKRYAEFMDEPPSLLYQEDAVDLLVKVGLSYEEAECARRAIVKKNRTEIRFYYNLFERTARKKGYSINEANAMFCVVEEETFYTICRASYIAMAQYLYMDTFFQKKIKE